MSQVDVPVFNPFDPGTRRDPYPLYQRIVEENPVYKLPIGVWVFARHADCTAVLRDPRSSSDQRNSSFYQQDPAMQERVVREREVLGVDRPFLFMDPPDHSRLRGLVQKAFTPRVVEALRPRAQQVVDGLLDAAAEKGQIEVVEEFAYPVPIALISEMLGVPADDAERFKDWSRELASSLDPEILTPDDVLARRFEVMRSFAEYFHDLIDERRSSPRDDLLSALVHAEEQGDRLTEPELLSTLILLLVAGHETTVNLIANGVLALLRNPVELARLRADPDGLARSTVEEVLRYDPPVQLDGRTALEDMEVGGVTIEKGEQSMLLLGAANRDPAVFDEPSRFDITRTDNRHLSFGFGIHHCLGAPLARMEGQIALSTLGRRFPGLELLDDDPPYKDNLVLRGLAELKVGLGSR